MQQSRWIRGMVAITLVVPLAVAAAGLQLRLGEHDFAWTDSQQESAHFTWSAVVINETTTSVEVEVAVDLLDDDDRVVHTDTTRHTAAANSRDRVEHKGSLPFDRAVDVVSFRFRIDPITDR